MDGWQADPPPSTGGGGGVFILTTHLYSLLRHYIKKHTHPHLIHHLRLLTLLPLSRTHNNEESPKEPF